jgi:hypothetical protein
MFFGFIRILHLQYQELCDSICKRLKLSDNSGSSKSNGGGGGSGNGCGNGNGSGSGGGYSDTLQLLSKVVQLSEVAKKQVSEDEQATIDDLWGENLLCS